MEIHSQLVKGTTIFVEVPLATNYMDSQSSTRRTVAAENSSQGG